MHGNLSIDVCVGDVFAVPVHEVPQKLSTLSLLLREIPWASEEQVSLHNLFSSSFGM